MSNIPKARHLIYKALALLPPAYDPDLVIGHDTGLFVTTLLHEALELMSREPPIRKTPPHSKKATPRLKESIRLYAKETPTASLQEIADMFDVNIGRVSEALNKP